MLAVSTNSSSGPVFSRQDRAKSTAWSVAFWMYAGLSTGSGMYE